MSVETFTDLYKHLNNDGSVTATIDSYDGIKAIFTTPPEAPPERYIVIGDIYAVNDESAKNNDNYSRECFLDIRCYARRTRSLLSVLTISDAVRKSLHRQTPFAWGGLTWEVVQALGSLSADTDIEFCRIVQFRFIVREGLSTS